MREPLPSVDLGRLDPPLKLLRRPHARGQLLYVATLEAIVVPRCRLDGGWRCDIITRRRYRPPYGSLELTDDEIDATQTSFPLTDRHIQIWEACMLWHAWTFRHWNGGRMRHLCRLLVDDLRTPNTLIVNLHPLAVRRLTQQVHVRPPALRQLLRRLVHAGAMTPLTQARDDHWGRHSLIIPDLPDGLWLPGHWRCRGTPVMPPAHAPPRSDTTTAAPPTSATDPSFPLNRPRHTDQP